MGRYSRIHLSAAVCAVFLLGCSEGHDAPEIQMLTHDFALQAIDIPAAQLKADPNCHQQMKKVLCVSDEKELGFDKNCSFKKVTAAQISQLLVIVDQLPPIQKTVMCKLGRIQIQKNIYSVGYANLLVGSDRMPIAGMIGVRPEVLSSEKPSNEMMSWKEQLNFGYTKANDPLRKPSPKGIFITETLPAKYSTYLPTVIHELNHIIDYINYATDPEFDTCTEDPAEPRRNRCKYSESSFAQLAGWGEYGYFPNMKKVKTEKEWRLVSIPEPGWHSQFPLIAALCYYECKKTTILPQYIPTVYAEFKKTSFTTPYSSKSILEDFAESATYYALQGIGAKFDYKVVNAQGEVYFDGHAHYLSDAVKRKRAWLDKFFKNNLLRLSYEP